MNKDSNIRLTKLHVMSYFERTIYSILLLMGLAVVGTFGFWWFQSNHIPHNFSGFFHMLDIVLFAILSYIVWYQIINEAFLWITAYFMKHPKYIKPEENLKVAFLTAFVPDKEPHEVLEKTLKAMVKVDYPHDTWVLDEGNDEKTKRLCKIYGVKHYSRKGIEKYNMATGMYKAKTKAGNYNSWYDQHGKKYEFVAQVDVDFVPKENFLRKTLGYFRDPDIAFVGSPQIYGNINDSWIAKGAAEQAYGFYGALQKGLFGNDMQLFIGSNHIVRVAAHNNVDGYSGHIVEDHLTGMKFYSKRWKSVYVPEILAVGEGPSTWDAYFSQQMRWAYGLIDILFTQSPKLFLKMRPKHVINYFLLQQYYFFGLAQALGILLLTLYFIFGFQSTAMKLEELLRLYPFLIALQLIIFLWLQKFNIDPKKESGLMLRAKLLNLAAWPIYLTALVSVLTKKRLTYKVTPKGSEQKAIVQPKLFIPHAILGSITAIDIVFAFNTHHRAMELLFWAWINTYVLYYFVFSEVLKKIVFILENLNRKILFSSPLLKIKSIMN